MTIKRLVRLVTVTLREDQQEFNIQRSPIEKKRRGEGKRKRKKRKKKKKKDEAIDAFFFCSGRLVVVDRDESGIKHRMCGLILD